MGNELTNRSSKPISLGSTLEHEPLSQDIGRLVLVAEDDPDDRFMLRRAWRKAGLCHRLIDVSDGEQVVRYLSGSPPFDNRAHNPFPDLLLLDLKMPKLNGFDVLAWIQGRPDLKRLNVVILSSSSLETDREFALKLGAKAFLTKPNETSQLVLLVKRLDELWLAHPGALPHPPPSRTSIIREWS